MRSIPGIAAVAAILACGAEGLDPSPELATIPGSLRYEATTAAGEPLIGGRLHIEVLPDSSIIGTWSAQWAAGADTTVQVGDQTGSGNLRGRQTGQVAYIDLNPGYADNNVILLSTTTERGLTGTWSWSTIAGPSAQGKFTALRD